MPSGPLRLLSQQRSAPEKVVLKQRTRPATAGECTATARRVFETTRLFTAPAIQEAEATDQCAVTAGQGAADRKRKCGARI